METYISTHDREAQMFDQLNLLTLDYNPIEEVVTTVDCKRDKRSFAFKSLVSLYRIENLVTTMSYFGISDNPDIRFGDHKAGRHANSDFRKALLERPQDFKFNIVCTFNVPDYCSKGNRSSAHAIESFAIAFYDTLNRGYNRSYKYHHDFCDRSHWEALLPPELLPLYKSANLERLNENVKPFIKKCNNYNTKRIYRNNDLVAKNLCRERLLMFKDMDIKLGKYAVTLANIDRSCYHRFMSGSQGALSLSNLLKFISAIEEHLGAADRFQLEKEYMEAKQLTPVQSWFVMH
jgi:hypothetical protein